MAEEITLHTDNNTKKKIYTALASGWCVWLESCGFMTSGSSGGQDKGCISSASHSPSDILKKKVKVLCDTHACTH